MKPHNQAAIGSFLNVCHHPATPCFYNIIHENFITVNKIRLTLNNITWQVTLVICYNKRGGIHAKGIGIHLYCRGVALLHPHKECPLFKLKALFGGTG